MTLSEDERERISQQEMVRSQVRTEEKRKQRPRLILLAALWMAILTALGLLGQHSH